MLDKCKSCAQREDCDKKELTEEQINDELNHLLDLENRIGELVHFGTNGKPSGMQWLFFNMLANKFRVIAKKIRPYLASDPDGDDLNWSDITSINELSDEYRNRNDEPAEED